MSISKERDFAIKVAETKTLDSEYVGGERKYNTYMTNEEWEPTIGKWNDEENYVMMEPLWKKALVFVREQYNANNAVLEYKDGFEKKSITCFEFTQKVLSVLIQEINRKGDLVLCLAALCRVAEKTGITVDAIKQHCSYCTLDMLHEFVCADLTSMNVYLEHVLNSDSAHVVKEIALAEALCYLRLENCPCEDWEKDLQYYSSIEEVLNNFDDSFGFLIMKIKEQILINKDISRNRNKTTEELFAGWDDE